MKLFLLLFAIISTPSFSQENPDSLYHNFTKAYDELSASKIANLYTENAETLNLYDGSKPNSCKGHAQIEQYFDRFFKNTAAKNQTLRLTFKIADRKKQGDYILDNGFYRLEVAEIKKPSFFLFGKFSTVLAIENKQWKFKTDATTNTDFIEYENAIVSTIPIREELLLPAYYDDLLGDYVNDKNEIIVIGRSQSRLYAFFEQSNEYRGLGKVNANTWTMGSTILSNKTTKTIKFYTNKKEFYESEKLVSTAIKKDFYTCEKVFYNNVNGQKLGGTIFKPTKPNGKAIVLVHGSGPQDRNGYASIIRLLADVIARQGITVLTFDKQGVWGSEGNYEKQNFESLAKDALAGISYLKSRKNFKLTKIGLGGSSQAGWIIAKAIQQSNNVDFALTIGAGGSGVSVIDQNLYNTELTMKCAGSYSANQIEKALKQQKYFFEFLQDPKKAKQLDDFTHNIAGDSLIRDWLFPISSQVDLYNRNQWFTALEINFDPLPVWQKYTKPVLMTFSEFDDSTPTFVAKAKVDALKKNNIKTELFKNAQHLGLETDAICNNEIGSLHKFHPAFFENIKKWFGTF